MSRNRAERRNNEKKKYKRRLRQELSKNTTIYDDNGKILTKPTVNDLENIRQFKDKKNHSTVCSCHICAGESYSRAEEKRSVKQEIKKGIQEEDEKFDEYLDEHEDYIRSLYDALGEDFDDLGYIIN